MNSKKVAIIIIVCILGILLIYMLPTEVTDITNAAVNAETGDIAFCYLDYSGRTEVLKVAVFNKEGQKLFSRSFLPNGSYADLLFHEGKLYVCVGRTEDLYCLQMDGSDFPEPVLAIEDVKATDAFSGWGYLSRQHTYSWGEYMYCYNEPGVFSHHASMTITHGENTKIIFQSPDSN